MKIPFEITLRFAALAGLLLSPSVRAQSPAAEEDVITIQLRTFGLGSLQTSMRNPKMKEGIEIFTQQFSETYTYTGPRKIQFFGSSALEGEAPLEAASESNSGQEGDGTAKPTPSPTPSQLALEVTIPEGMKKVLLFVDSAPVRSGALYRAFIMDDSQSRIDARNIQFYNLTDVPLAVKTFGEVAWVVPRDQKRWDVSEKDSISSFMIGVNDPVQRVLYSNRLRLRPSERLIFLAYGEGQRTPDGVPRIVVSYLLQDVAQNSPSPSSPDANPRATPH